VDDARLTCAKISAVRDRYRTADGWSVEAIRLTCTPNHHDGEWLRVAYHGWWVADVRSVAELQRWFPIAELEEDGLVLAA
jgi:hypothetical protein